MPTLAATVGASTANSYLTTEAADTLADERLNATAWTGASASDKARALIQATRRVDTLEFRGEPVNPLTGTSAGTTQALKWPRYSVPDEAGWTYGSDVIPECVKLATFELALAYLAAGTTDVTAEDGLDRFESLTIGPITIKPRGDQKADALPDGVLRRLRHVLAAGHGGTRLVRG